MSKTEKRIIAVDIDGTLCLNAKWWAGETLVPRPEIIAKVNHLYDLGNYIIIYTARRREDEFITKQWLAEQGVKYHVAVFEKLTADVYLDDKALNVKEIDKL